MLVLRRVRFIAAPGRRFASSDDDVLFANDKIESKHRPKSNHPVLIALRALWRIAFYGSACLFTYTYYNYKSQENLQEIPLIFNPMLNAVKRVDHFVLGVYKIFVDPPVDKLLPDMPKPPPGYMQPKTLVLDLKGTLVSIEYVFGKGYEVMKRPGLTEFLNKASQMYEVVIFSDEDFQLTHQLAQSLDPNHRIFSGRLGKESMCYRSGELIKDLSYLNRDLKNVIVIEKNVGRVKNHPDNVIILPEYKGATDDRALVELLPFLEHIVKDRVSDVREEINKFGHVETGKKYVQQLIKIRDKVTERQQKGLSGFFNKMPRQQYNQTKPTGPEVTSELPKPSPELK